MKQIKLWMTAAILVVCGTAMVSCFSDTKKSGAASATVITLGYKI